MPTPAVQSRRVLSTIQPSTPKKSRFWTTNQLSSHQRHGDPRTQPVATPSVSK